MDRRTLLALSEAGKLLGNWNDWAHPGDTKKERGLCWRILDKVAGRLYVLGDRTALSDGQADG